MTGVATRIQQDNPTALYVHCLAHCTNLCLQTVGRQCEPVRSALNLVMELSHLIRISPKQSGAFQTLQNQLSPGLPSLKPLCPTRWTVRTSAIHSVLENYDVLFKFLDDLNAKSDDKKGRKVGGVLAQMEKFSTYPLNSLLLHYRARIQPFKMQQWLLN